MEKTIIVVPTYNEAGNIPGLIAAVFQNVPDAYLLIVDDSSPDGTAALVADLQKAHPHLMLLVRAEKQGLGVAYRAGFRHALETHPDVAIIGMMDADFYHDPADLPRLIAAARDTDMVIGSVYARGGCVPESFTLSRRFLSRGGNLYCRVLFGYPLTDWTNAFVMIRASALRKIKLDSLMAREFAFIFGLKYALLKSGATWKDIGVVASERTAGESKVRLATILEALKAPWGLILHPRLLYEVE